MRSSVCVWECPILFGDEADEDSVNQLTNGHGRRIAAQQSGIAYNIGE